MKNISFSFLIIILICLCTGCGPSMIPQENEKNATNQIEVMPNTSFDSVVEEVSSVSLADNNIDELLRPYQEVINQLNSEYGYHLVIPDNEKESIYNTYKNMTPAEFEETIKKELEASASWEPLNNNSNDRIQETAEPPEDEKSIHIGSLLSGVIKEVAITKEDNTIRLTDDKSIYEVIQSLEDTDFLLSTTAETDEPGAVSITIEIIMESETVSITLPYFLYEGNVYCAEEKSIQLFDSYFD